MQPIKATASTDGEETSPLSPTPQSPLYSTEPVVRSGERVAPLIVVGLPRSGSSFLAHVLTGIEDWYVFDDLFLLRHARSIGCDGDLTKAQLENLVHFLGWQLRARIRWPSFDPPDCEWDEVDAIEEALLTTFKKRPITWEGLLEEWMTRLAHHHGCTRWGYKAPQDFMNADELIATFPGVQFVFLVRDPRKVMASKKYVDGEDGTPGEYHPAVYARYWRMSVEAAFRIRRKIGNRILLMKFEDLVSDPNGQARELAAFLGTEFKGDVQRDKGNTSFSGNKRKTLTALEERICERIAGETMDELGYELRNPKPQASDFLDLAWRSCRFTYSQLRRFVTNGDARQSILMFIRSLFSKGSRR